MAGQHHAILVDIILTVIFHRGRLIGQQDRVFLRTRQFFNIQRQTLIAAGRQVVIHHKPIIIACMRVKNPFDTVAMRLRQTKHLKRRHRIFGNKFYPNRTIHSLWLSCVEPFIKAFDLLRKDVRKDALTDG